MLRPETWMWGFDEAWNRAGGVLVVVFIKADGSVGTLADVNFDADSIHTRYLNIAVNDEWREVVV